MEALLNALIEALLVAMLLANLEALIEHDYTLWHILNENNYRG